ncbi:MAG: hypothetical protein QM756_08635 [Polyangiaceae bacterium]
MCSITIPALAQEANDDAAPADASKDAGDPPPPPPPASSAASAPAAAAAEAPVDKAEPAAKKPDAEVSAEKDGAPGEAPIPTPQEQIEGWHTFISGYFRAPLALGVSPRSDPDNPTGPTSTQVSYGPTRTIDASYFSFAYTRLQEQDWAELFIHEKKKHIEAVVGWMGYWFGAVGFRNPDASWVPGMAYLVLDTDFQAGDVKPNVALTVGAFWPKFGYMPKYDTFTLGQFRQLGEQVKLAVPVNPDVSVSLTQGFGAGRDGSFIYQINPPIYGAKTGVDLVTYVHLALNYKKQVEIGLHYNSEWTADPNLWQQAMPGKTYADVRDAGLSVIGAEFNLNMPYFGHLWLSPSYLKVKNGWALGGNGGTEVMHSLGGAGVAGNYMAWTNSPADSTGSGSMFNLGFLYENTLSSVQGKVPGTQMPEVTLSAFGLFDSASRDLPAGSVISQSSNKQLKLGADVTVQTTNWLGFMLRYDQVNYNMDEPAYIFSAVTARAILSSHYLSGESIYFQYSRYRYGDRMVLNGTWPWNTPLVAGSDILQGGPYSGSKPDMDVFKIQASVAF